MGFGDTVSAERLVTLGHAWGEQCLRRGEPPVPISAQQLQNLRQEKTSPKHDSSGKKDGRVFILLGFIIPSEGKRVVI